MLDELAKWCDYYLLDVSIEENILQIPEVGKFLVLEPKYYFIEPVKDGFRFTEITQEEYQAIEDPESRCVRVINEDYELILSEQEYFKADEVDYLLFQFGKDWFYSDTLATPKLKEFKYLGKPKLEFGEINHYCLAIHGAYDLCNGSKQYPEWCKKAKFLGIKVLGIAEENTLGGIIPFQSACKKAGIRSVIGESIKIKFENGNSYFIKAYCKNKEGWANLLIIHKLLRVDNKGFIDYKQLLTQNLNNLILIINSEVEVESFVEDIAVFPELYYSVDSTEWDNQEKDEQYLSNLEKYLTKYKDIIKPVLVNDAYYLEQKDSGVRKILGQINSVGYRNNSQDQYFKTIDNALQDYIKLSPDLDKMFEFIVNVVEQTQQIFLDIDFQVLTGQFYLPKYERNEEEAEKFENNELVLLGYIEKGLQEKVIDKGLDFEKYLERVEYELEIIKKGGFVDYFLILADLYNFCRENGIWYGVGRGSAAGCLISYLCNIVSIDPLEYKLLFERFLNPGRIGKSLPDIDCDFQGTRRDEIKRYLEDKYGRDQVISIGTYGTFKLKNTIKDLARINGIDSSYMNYVTTFFPEPEQQTPQYYYEIFQQACRQKVVREFVQKYPEVVEKVQLFLSQPKNNSIHAAGMVIVPKEFGTSYQQLPVKEVDGLLVSEWEGHYIDDAGFLKIDILGIAQLDKFAAIARQIKEQVGDDISFDSIILNEQDVLQLFRQGDTEDVFQFGAAGLKAYCKQLQPDTVEDLIATVALYRPGPIESGTHLKYIKRKAGKEFVESDPGCEEITSSTFGLIVYQEQVMQICQKVANFSLTEADDIRKALGKMKPEIVKGYRDTFMERVLKNGFEESQMSILWAKMEAFAAYAFNRSHAACYAITGYYSQWFKHHYPLQFWTVSLQFSNDKEMVGRIVEIQKNSPIKVSPIDINLSELEFKGDVGTNSIYWAMDSVKWVGDKIVESILTERTLHGQFFSLEEFIQRTKGHPGFNKRAVSHLIICGAFDRLEKIKNITERYLLLEAFYKFTDTEFKAEYLPMSLWREHQWVLRQKELSGFGVIDFRRIILQSHLFSGKVSKFKENCEVLEFDTSDSESCIVAGVVTKIAERKSKNGPFCQVELFDNKDIIYITIWPDIYQQFIEEIKTSEKKVMIFDGRVEWDDYKQQYSIKSTKTSKLQVV